MVLGPLDFPKRNEQGVTLLELLVAIALSGLVAAMATAFFRDAGHAARQIQGHRESDFQSQVFFSSLCENLLAGAGVLSLGPGRLVLLNGHNRKVEYRWDDSTLMVNGHPLGFRVGAFTMEPEGPERPAPSDAFHVMDASWDLDSLDEDRDGRIDFRELDRDHSDDLNLPETRFVAKYKLALTVIERNIPTTLTAVIHPRNHLAQMPEKVGNPSDSEEAFPAF
jgi:prepilin-type N-terminal cleavage/methylation domain-containing protein